MIFSVPIQNWKIKNGGKAERFDHKDIVYELDICLLERFSGFDSRVSP